MMKSCIVILVVILIYSFIFAQGGEVDIRSYGEEVFFRIMDQIVVSASKRVQKISDVPVAISVITREDIINSGAQSIPEALRMVPGVFVMQVTGGQYEVALRGTTNMPSTTGTVTIFSRRILVLIDGRSFFNDIFGGTFWEFLPITINDIERIEVVRGPASALFGGNAASGVINIITRDYATIEERITNISSTFGNKGKSKNSAYYANIFNDFFVSFSFEKNKKDRYEYTEYDPTKAEWVSGRGQRDSDNYPPADKQSLNANKSMLTLNYEIDENQFIDLKLGYSNGDFNVNGPSGDLLTISNAMEQKLGKMTYQAKAFGSESKLSYSYLSQKLGEEDGTYGFDAEGNISGKDGIQNGAGLYSHDIEMQSIMNLGEKDILVAGLNFRYSKVKSDGAYFVDMGYLKQEFKAAYLNNEYSFIKDKFKLVTACRVDKYDIPDITEYSPQAALFYKVNKDNTLTLNYSEAIRIPFTLENYIFAENEFSVSLTQIFPNIGYTFSWYGNQNLKVPRIKSLEIGYLTQPNKKINLDLHIFTHTMKDMVSWTAEYNDNFAPTGKKSGLSLNVTNISEKYKTYGVELDYRMLLSKNWNFWANSTYQSMKLGSSKIDFSPGLIANMGVSGKLMDKLKLSVSANYSGKTEVPLNNIIDRNLEALKEGNPPASTVNDAFVNYLTSGGIYDIGSGNMTAVHTTISTLYGSGDTANAALLFQACLGSSGSGSDADVASRTALKGVSPGLSDTEITLVNAITTGMLVTSVFQETARKTTFQGTDAYLLLNFRLAYSVNKVTEFAVTGRNILNKKHRESPYGEEIGATYMSTLNIKF